MSPYFPTVKETIYQCRGCRKWFLPVGVSCCMAHPPGTCCHYGETEVPDPREVSGER